MAKRKRDMQLNFRVSAEELAVIEQKMSQFGTSNREAYLRKMALDGYTACAAAVPDVVQDGIADDGGRLGAVPA